MVSQRPRLAGPQPDPAQQRPAADGLGSGPELTAENWRAVVRERVEALAWDRVAADVRPFVEPGADASLLTMDNLRRLLA